MSGTERSQIEPLSRRRDEPVKARRFASFAQRFLASTERALTFEGNALAWSGGKIVIVADPGVLRRRHAVLFRPPKQRPGPFAGIVNPFFGRAR